MKIFLSKEILDNSKRKVGINIPFLQQREVISGQITGSLSEIHTVQYIPKWPGNTSEVRKLDDGRKLFRIIGWELTCE